LYGVADEEFIDALIDKYWEFAPKTPEGYLNRTPEFNTKLGTLMKGLIEHDIMTNILNRHVAKGSQEQYNYEQLGNEYINKINHPGAPASYESRFNSGILPFNPDKITLERLKELFTQGQKSRLAVTDDPQLEKVFNGKTYRRVLDEEIPIIKSARPGYQQISLADLSRVFSSGLVTRFTPSPELQHLTYLPNQVFLTFVRDNQFPYMTIARFNQATNQLLPPI
jgi:hypothetical protein